MFDCIHKMRTRIMTSPKFNGDRILVRLFCIGLDCGLTITNDTFICISRQGAILFEDTMNREINGVPTAEFLWKEKNIVPFLKVDKGLEPEKDGVQMMKPIELESICKTAINKNVFGTKMRSVIKYANKEGIKAIVEQQFSFGKQIMAKGLIPILEPGKDI